MIAAGVRRWQPAASVALLSLAPGCVASDVRPPTFNREVAPIVFEHCSPCHRPGGAGPFDLLDYDDVRRRAREIGVVTRSRFMPPWQPARGYAELIGERGLNDRQIATIADWIAAGAPEGDPAELPPPPAFAEGWQLGEPDLVVELERPYTLTPAGSDVIRNFVVPIPVEATRWVRTVELHPGNPKIVHHAIVKTDRTRYSRRLDAAQEGPGFDGMEMGRAEAPDGHVIVWAPGTAPHPGDPEIAWRLDPGTDLVLQLHMVPSGKPEQVRPAIGFHFAAGPPRLTPLGLLLRNEQLEIPAGEADWVVEDAFELPAPVRVMGLFPHAHYLGKRMEVFAELPDGERRWLLLIEDWDFNWQDMYRFVEPPALPAGSTLRLRYSYDNSSANVQNPNLPPIRVVGGNRSVDEMCTLLVQVLPQDPADFERLQLAQFVKIAGDEPDNAMAHYNLGVIFARQGNLAAAARHYRRSLELYPDDPMAHYGSGSVHARLGDLPAAERSYRRAIELNPRFAEAHYILGRVYLDQNRLELAADSYRRAIEVEPGYARAYQALGRVRQRQGRGAEAVELFRRAAQLDPALAR